MSEKNVRLQFGPCPGPSLAMLLGLLQGTNLEISVQIKIRENLKNNRLEMLLSVTKDKVKRRHSQHGIKILYNLLSVKFILFKNLYEHI